MAQADLDAILYADRRTDETEAARCQGENEASYSGLSDARRLIENTWAEARVLAEDESRDEEAAYVAGWAAGYQNILDGLVEYGEWR